MKVRYCYQDLIYSLTVRTGPDVGGRFGPYVQVRLTVTLWQLALTEA